MFYYFIKSERIIKIKTNHNKVQNTFVFLFDWPSRDGQSNNGNLKIIQFEKLFVRENKF
jgi:hypothetical protein